MVNREVLARRSWLEADFNISFDGLDQETRNEVFRVSHIESYRNPIGVDGDDFSLFIHANCASMKVVGEYKQQQ